MTKSEWVHCPVCGSKTRLQIRRDTELKNFPLYCPKCKQESLIDAKHLSAAIKVSGKSLIIRILNLYI